MATQNRRIAAYLPPEIDQKLKAFKIDAGLATKRNPTKNDSQALIAILIQFFGLNHEAPYASAAELRQNLADLEAKLDRLSSALTDKIAHLEDDLTNLKQAKIDIEETEPTQPKAESGAILCSVPGQLDLLASTPTHPEGNIEPIEAGETLLQFQGVIFISRQSDAISQRKNGGFRLRITSVVCHFVQNRNFLRECARWSIEAVQPLKTKQTTMRLEQGMRDRLQDICRDNGISREVLIEAMFEHCEAEPAVLKVVLAEANRRMSTGSRSLTSDGRSQ